MDTALTDRMDGTSGAHHPMNILIISDTYPFPPDDGTKIQIFNRIRFLSETNRITLLCVLSEPIPERLLDGMKPYCQVSWIQAPSSRIADHPAAKVWNFLRSFWFGVPYYVKDFCSNRAQQTIDNAVSNGNYDVIEADNHAAFFMQKKWGPLTVCIFHSVATASFGRMIKNTQKPLLKLKYRIFQNFYKNYHKHICRNSDLCITLTPQDEKELRKICDGFVVLNSLTNGIDLDYFRYQPSGRTPSGVCLVGLMRYEANIDAALHFYREIFPRLRLAHSDLQFFIVGSSPHPEVKKLSDAPGVVVTGYVEDVRTWMTEAGISVIPVRTGGGILNKILEALAMGVPVVTYPVCVEGLGVKNGDELLIAENAADFAESINRLLESASLRKKLAVNGRRYVESHHQWRSIIARYEDEIRSRIAEARLRE